MKKIIPILEECIQNASLVKITISKPRNKDSKYKNIFVRPVEISDQLMYQMVKRTKTQDFTENVTPDSIVQSIEGLLNADFYNADVFCEDVQYHYLQSKKGVETIKKKKTQRRTSPLDHNRKKQQLIPESTPYLQDLGLSSSNGKIFGESQKKFKQINKYIEIVSNLVQKDHPISCFDMGCGKGYLTFALYDYLQRSNPDFSMTGIEIRPDLVDKCNAIADHHEMSKLSFEVGSIDTYQISTTDMVIALHACDIATDMAIAAGIKSKAKYIITAPCCHKQIRKEIDQKKSSIASIIQHGIFLERQAEMITDTIRALLLESQGYETKVFEFISSEHTAKNIMITARYTGKPNVSALKQIEDLKSEFGIRSHYLQTIL